MINGNDIVYLTEEGLAKIKEELEHLKTTRREEIAGRLAAAVSMGDLSENADFEVTKQEQAFVEGRIRDLEDSLRRAQVIQHDGRTDMVRVGSTVTILADGEEEPETYYIVGVHEADPGNGRISNESPIGQALLGAKVGQVVAAQTPAGRLSLKIEAIE